MIRRNSILTYMSNGSENNHWLGDIRYYFCLDDMLPNIYDSQVWAKTNCMIRIRKKRVRNRRLYSISPSKWKSDVNLIKINSMMIFYFKKIIILEQRVAGSEKHYISFLMYYNFFWCMSIFFRLRKLLLFTWISKFTIFQSRNPF